MTAFFLFVVLVLVIIILIINNGISYKVSSLERTVNKLVAEIKSMQTQQTVFVKESVVEPQPTVEPEVVQIHEQKIEEDIIVESIHEQFDKPQEIVEERDFEFSQDEISSVINESKSNAYNSTKTQKEPTIKEPKKSADLEKFIGENLINKIGIAILVLGIGFFVKYAIDKQWINEIGRVFIGILCGGILLGVAHKLRKTFTSFSSVLVGGGMSVLYFTIALAFHEYHIFSQTMAFIIMVFITAFTILLSITYNRKEIAVLAMIGGFSSPFMLSTGEGNYVILFSYLLILNVGILILAFYKKWQILNIMAYIFTILIYAGWLVTRIHAEALFPHIGALFFATLFYFVFFAMNIIQNVVNRISFKSLDFAILLSNTFLYFSAGNIILHQYSNGNFVGLFTILIAVFNFVFVFLLRKNASLDKNLFYLLIGLVLTFISLAAPIQLHGNHITLFWALESVLLLWLSQKSGISLIKLSSVIVLILMGISLVLDWTHEYGTFSKIHGTILLHKGFITGIVCLFALWANIFLLKKEKTLEFLYSVPIKAYKGLLQIEFIIFLYVLGLLEMQYQLNYYVENSMAVSIYIGIYNFMYIIGMYLFANKQETKNEFATQSVFYLGLLGIASYFVFYLNQITWLRNGFVRNEGVHVFDYGMHYLLVALLIGLVVISLKKYTLIFSEKSFLRSIFLWFVCFVFVFVASAELDSLVVVSAFKQNASIYEITQKNHMIGFSILWGISSFIFMIYGMKKQVKSFRVISLALFLVTLLKLFIFDISRISEGGKIAAFISLGVLLLIISFMYQKLKNLILVDEKSNTEQK